MTSYWAGACIVTRSPLRSWMKSQASLNSPSVSDVGKWNYSRFKATRKWRDFRAEAVGKSSRPDDHTEVELDDIPHPQLAKLQPGTRLGRWPSQRSRHLFIITATRAFDMPHVGPIPLVSCHALGRIRITHCIPRAVDLRIRFRFKVTTQLRFSQSNGGGNSKQMSISIGRTILSIILMFQQLSHIACISLELKFKAFE